MGYTYMLYPRYLRILGCYYQRYLGACLKGLPRCKCGSPMSPISPIALSLEQSKTPCNGRLVAAGASRMKVGLYEGDGPQSSE